MLQVSRYLADDLRTRLVALPEIETRDHMECGVSDRALIFVVRHTLEYPQDHGDGPVRVMRCQRLHRVEEAPQDAEAVLVLAEMRYEFPQHIGRGAIEA